MVSNYNHSSLKKCQLILLTKYSNRQPNELTLKMTPLPKVTSPETVKWSSSKQSGMFPNRFRNSLTFEKMFPSLTNGTDGKLLNGFIPKWPFFWVNKLLMINKRSLVVLTGKKRLLGTLIPIAPLKLLIAAPEAVSSWITLIPLSVTLNIKWLKIMINYKMVIR